MIKGKQRFHSLNFILWFSFLIFAAFIIALTWIFQTTLLRVFFTSQAEEDLGAIGRSAYERLNGALRGREDGVVGNYVDEYVNYCIADLQRDNPLVSIYVMDQAGEVLFPSDEGDFAVSDDTAQEEDYPDLERFNMMQDKLARQEDEKSGIIFKLSDNYYIFGAQLDVPSQSSADSDMYLYISYSTELSEMTYGTMRIQLIFISIIVIFLALVISALISMKLTKPITRITRAAKRMAEGDFTVNFKGEYSYAEMDALAETLDYAKEEIGKSDQLQKEVLANVTHDLKTPLTMIKAYASMIQEISGNNPEKRVKHTQIIIDESDRLTSLVNDILNLSKIRSGMDILKTRTFNLSEFVHTVLERFDFLSETQGYTIVRDIDDELYTEADMEKIEQVVYNLVGNAINYTGEDKKIVVGLKRIEGGKLRFTVTDTGKGIPEEEIKTIWDRYYRSAETHKRPIKGTGLGLSIVKTILLKHDFEFGVESEVGKGSTFYVLFPEK